MNHINYTKKIDIKELVVEKCHRHLSHFFDASKGKSNASLAFVKKGTVTLNSKGKQIIIPTGSLFYLPNGAKYNSVWKGNPDIEYYGIHMVFDKYNIHSKEDYAIQYIKEFSTQETEQLFDDIYALFSAQDPIGELQALGMFYTFYAKIIPYLQPSHNKHYNPALLVALDYIENNLSQDFSVETLAKHCCISVSRLHHLFQTELQTTPIKYRNQLRVENAAYDLLNSDFAIDDIAERNGFHSTTYFREIFKQTLGISPFKYRKTIQS